MYFSPCINAIFFENKYGKLDLVRRLEIVKETGYNSFEFWAWWDKDLDILTEAIAKLNLHVETFCTRFISLVDETKHEEYLIGLTDTISVAKKLGCSKLITQTGNALTNIPREKQYQNLVKGLKACVPVLEENKITLLVEPLNLLVDHPGYFLSRSDEAFALVKEVDSDYVKVLFDIYHQQITEGNIIRNITNNLAWIDHFHIADNPGRHEPGTGELNYHNILQAIKEAGYTGAVGLEYFPTKDPKQSLSDFLENYKVE